MKKNASSRNKAKTNACGHAQTKGEDYNKDETAVLVVNEITIRVMLALMLTLRMLGNVHDTKGAFLCGEFTNERKMHIEVPQGWKKH